MVANAALDELIALLTSRERPENPTVEDMRLAERAKAAGVEVTLEPWDRRICASARGLSCRAKVFVPFPPSP